MLRLPDTGELKERLSEVEWSDSIFMSALLLITLLCLICLITGIWWSREPAMFDTTASSRQQADEMGVSPVTGFTTVATLITLIDTLLDKRGGYISNDLAPPGVYLDNISNWEFGVLVQVRDLTRIMRNDFSRSQSQSSEDEDLSEAEGRMFFDNSSWLLPSSEREYRDGHKLLQSYLARLSNPLEPDAQFYARADNLRQYLAAVETRLGSLSQRLSLAVGKKELDMGLAFDARGSSPLRQPQKPI